MNIILQKIDELLELSVIKDKELTSKLAQVEQSLTDNVSLSHQLKEESLLVKEREAKVDALEITAATKVKLAEDVARVSSESNALEDSKKAFTSYKAEEKNKLDALRADGDLQQDSLSKQKEQLAIDRENYKAEVLKECAKETKE